MGGLLLGTLARCADGVWFWEGDNITRAGRAKGLPHKAEEAARVCRGEDVDPLQGSINQRLLA